MRRLAVAATCGALLATPAFAQAPLGTMFTYQGRLAESGSPANGTYDFRFVLYDAPVGGNQVGPVVTRDDVIVATGLFAVGVDFGAVFGTQRRYLEVAVRPGASTGAYDVVSGRQELTAAPSALFGASAPWTGVTGKPAGFADDVDNDVLGSITCANGQVPKSNGATWACGSDLNTTYTGGAGIQVNGTVISVPALAITNAMIADNAVTTVKLVDGAVNAPKLLDNAVITAKILDGAVGTSKLGDSSVTTTKLANDAVTQAKMADNSVGTAEIQNNAVNNAKIAPGSIASAQLQAGAVGGTHIQPDAIVSPLIAAGTIQSSDIAPGGILAANIGVGQVGSSHIANDSVTAADIAPDAIGRSELAGTELAVYQQAQGCSLGGFPVFAIQCPTAQCSATSFFNCAGTACSAAVPTICNNTLVGYLLSASIP